MSQYELNHDQKFHFWDETNAPVLTIKSGDTVRFETRDCINNVLTDRYVKGQPPMKYELAVFDKVHVNPVTGPIYIEDAEPGDTLEVHIDKIELKDVAVVTCQEKYGQIGHLFDETTYKLLAIEGDHCVFDEKLNLPLDPMVGVLGVTPKGERIGADYNGVWGGNMDNTAMREGITLYLPIQVKGALAGVGDVHAVMGDAEMNCSAVEAPAHVTLTFKVRKDLKIPEPVLATPTHFITVASRKTADEGIHDTINQMYAYIKERTPLDPEEISMLLTSIGNSEVCVACGDSATMRFTMPWYALKAYGFDKF